MKLCLIILGFALGLINFNRDSAKGNEDSISVLAELISEEGGSKVHVAKYRVLKTIHGQLTNDTIYVGYYFYNQNDALAQTAILTLEEYEGDSMIPDYYIYPEYNPSAGMEKVKIASIAFEYWEACEKGEKECTTLEFSREQREDRWFLIMPCGGTASTVYLSKKNGIPNENEIIQKSEISHSECPPIFELTNLDDGKYFVYMLACGLGGQVEIILNTN